MKPGGGGKRARCAWPAGHTGACESRDSALEFKNVMKTYTKKYISKIDYEA